ncbi:MAG: hypothetical protein HY908_03290 [Myxococcales bacterium]|nr:hypothetical protein [Myxococcales bacterium]
MLHGDRLGLSFRHPGDTFQPRAEARPLMQAALGPSPSSCAYPFLDDFARSFVVVRLERVPPGTSDAPARWLDRHRRALETGIEQELGAGTRRAPLPHVSVPGAASDGWLVDERISLRFAVWLRKGAAGEPERVVTVTVASLDDEELRGVLASVTLR